VLTPVNAAVISELKHPCLESATFGVELAYGAIQIEEHLLNCFLGFPFILYDVAGNVKNQRAITLKQDRERVVAAILQALGQSNVIHRAERRQTPLGILGIIVLVCTFCHRKMTLLHAKASGDTRYAKIEEHRSEWIGLSPRTVSALQWDTVLLLLNKATSPCTKRISQVLL